ncbi:MAG: 2,3-bisphosphoglycerate-dependent phosphoglycerate mutase [Nanoarchaeota archaeon]|nr:2,3-bisphosphoglycerate-dependent phosphoglycerate mutase [Nanoarchaeota archaeon]
MKRGCKVFLFRHGQTYFNRDNKFTGFIDSKLSPAGKDDAKIVGLRLKNEKIGIAFHTSLSRSKETLNEVLKFHKNVRLVQDNRIIERSYGDLSEKTHLEVVKKYGTKKYDNWHRSFDKRPPKGESFADVEKRVKSFINYLEELIKKENVNIAISAHGNSIRLFRKIMENLSVKETCEMFVPYDQVYEYEI